MIEKIRIRNFKVFGERQHLELAPITLIYGPNSGGKSTVIQSLLLLKQSIEASQSIAQRFLTPNGRWVDLGQSKSMHHLHRTDEGIELGITFRNSSRMTPFFRPSDVLSLDAHFRNAEGVHSRPLPELIDAVLQLAEKDGPGFFAHIQRSINSDLRTLRDDMEDRQFRENRFRFRSIKDATGLFEFFKTRLPAIADSSRFYSAMNRGDFENSRISFRSPLSVSGGTFLPSFIRSPKDKDVQGFNGPFAEMSRVLTSFSRSYERIFSGMSYLGPLRSRPKRIYEYSRQYSDTVGSSGEFTIDALARRNHLDDEDGATVSLLNDWFARFEIPYQIELSGVGDEVLGDIAKLTLVDTRTGVRVAATDVGFGIGQVLPIILEGILASTSSDRSKVDKIVCVEQPELHLHPRLQANIGDFLVETQKIGKCQWIVETHSESLMLRLQKLIRKGELRSNKVAVLYVEPIGSNGSRVMRLRMDEAGNFLDEWPGGFFEESFRETFF